MISNLSIRQPKDYSHYYDKEQLVYGFIDNALIYLHVIKKI